MSQDYPPHKIPAPCVIDSGIVVDRDDIKRLLNDLGSVRYIHTLDGEVQSEGEGWLVEVFSDSKQATLVANGNLYINLQSFDYLQIGQSDTKEAYFDLIQDNRQLRLIPLCSCLQEPEFSANLDAATIEAMVTQVLSAKWDVQLDDDVSF
jgi:hypothetical protein